MQNSFESVVNLLESYRGRDKVIRTLCYGSQLVGGVISQKTANSSQLGKSLLLLSAQLSHCRTVLRLFDDLSMVSCSWSYGLGAMEEDKVIRWISVLSNVADHLYYPCEHVAWAADAELIKVKSDKWWTLSTVLWALSLLLGTLRSLRIILTLRRKAQNHRRAAQGTGREDGVIIPAEIQRRIQGEVLSVLSSLADLSNAIHWMPSGFLWAGRFPHWLVGLMGTTSSLIVTHQPGMEEQTHTISSDEVASFEDEVLKSSKTVPHKTALTEATRISSASSVVMETRGVPSDAAQWQLEGKCKSPQLEDLDSFSLIEPPPLDWRSDSSSEACSLKDIDEPGSFPTDSLEAPIDELSNYDGQNTSSTPTEVEDLTSQEMGMNESSIAKKLEKSLEKKNEEKPKDEVGQPDVDHSHIQMLLTQLHLFHPTPAPEDPLQEPQQPSSTPNSVCDSHLSPSIVPEACSHQTCPEANTVSGLLFTESHQKDLLELLEEPEPKEPPTTFMDQATSSHNWHMAKLIEPQTICISPSAETDEMVTISYDQDIWHRHLQDEFVMSGYSEHEVLEQWQQSKGLASDELASHNADVDIEPESQPSYKDVPGPCDPEDLLDGVIFGAKYLGSTQLRSDRNPSTSARMAQAQEAVDRIKAPEGESQPMTEVDLFISTKRIKVLTADTQEAMMDHPLQMISYIADIGSVVVLMARRKPTGQQAAEAEASSSSPPKACWMICHLFSSEDAQVIAQAIGQAFGVAYQQFLQANGIKGSDLRPGEYCLSSEELYNGDLVHFSRSENIREVCISKPVGEILGVAVVESGWGSILPTVVVANLLHGGPAERSGELSIGDRIMSVNGTSLVGLSISACHSIIRDLKNQSQVKLNIVHCPPVTMAIIRRPDPKYQLGFSVEDGIICSLMRGGIAERGGIRVGHRIIEINGQSVVATPHDKIIHILSSAVGEIHLKTMPTSTYRLLTGQEQPVFL
ncbi:hypothetical protein P4O66_013072 [Electrophorus voltai]|uniref:Amyloid-beta A4 precursor protein-binding family A member 3 n=1 Tax=Electrophorus voltai TaxID=2609070 RepID=A0AAD9E6C2_9TELE|nr:hypothetical protein P4O66_013072 [Electrophorus voltai]